MKNISLEETTRPTGRATMSSGIRQAGNYHRYLLEHTEGFMGQKIMEIGCGYGQYTEFLLKRGKFVLATDIDNDLLACLQKNLGSQHPHSLKTQFIDLNQNLSIIECLSWQPDTLLCLNVLEHIEHDKEVIKYLYTNSRANTVAIFLCPAHQALFGFMDQQAGHFRRYNRQTFQKLFTSAGWSIAKCFYINPIGAIGWFVRNKLIPPSSRSLDDPKINSDIAIFDKYLLPISRTLDPFFKYTLGQSVVVIAKKT
jgi:SAM-dependent methyltransferase